jgi:hypothetical protein
VVSIPACHAGDPGSIPGNGVSLFWIQYTLFLLIFVKRCNYARCTFYCESETVLFFSWVIGKQGSAASLRDRYVTNNAYMNESAWNKSIKERIRSMLASAVSDKELAMQRVISEGTHCTNMAWSLSSLSTVSELDWWTC